VSGGSAGGGASSPPERPTAPAAAVSVVAGRGALFIGGAKAFFMLSGFLQNVFLTRILGVAEFGAYSVVTKVVSIVNNAVVQSTIQSVSKFTAEDDVRAGEVKRAGLRMQLVLGGAIGLAFFAFAPLFADAVKAPDYTDWFRIVAIIPFLYALYAVFVGSANGLRRFRAQAGFDVGFSTAKTVLVLGGAAALGTSGAFAGFAAAAAVILVAAARVMGLPARTGGAFPARRLLLFMGEVVAYGLLLNLALNYDLPLLRRFAGAAAATADQASVLAGAYEALRTVALLPNQALIVITFVIFPLVSRSTFAEDRQATAAYVTQSLRYAFILAAAMGVVLAARPAAVLGILYKPEYGLGAAALPILVTGQCCLALSAVACAILNAAGRVRMALVVVAATVAVGAAVAAITVPRVVPGPAMLAAMAAATSTGMVVGFLIALAYLRARLGGGPPGATVLRVAAASIAAVAVGRLLPGTGKIGGLAALAVVGAVYLAALVLFRELGPADRAKLGKILRRG